MAVFWNPTNAPKQFQFRDTEAAAEILRVKLQSLEVRDPNDFDGAFNVAIRERAGCDSNSDTRASATSFTSGAGSFTRSDSVGVLAFIEIDSGYNGRSLPRRFTSCRSGGTGRRARLRGV